MDFLLCLLSFTSREEDGSDQLFVYLCVILFVVCESAFPPDAEA